MSRTCNDDYVPFFYGCGVRYSLIPRKARRLSFSIEGYSDWWDEYMPTTQKDLEQPYCFKTWSSAQYAAREWEKRFRKHGFKGDDAIICVTVCWRNSVGLLRLPATERRNSTLKISGNYEHAKETHTNAETHPLEQR